MNIDVSEQSVTRKTITVAFDAAEVDEQHRSLVKEFSKQARIPGFRPGKVPVALIKKRYAKELKDELNRKMVRDAYDKGLEKSDHRVFAVVEVKENEFSAGSAGEVGFVVDIEPEFDLPEYKGIEVESLSEEVSEDEINEALDRLRGERAEYNIVEKAAEAGDYVKCSYEGKVGKKLIADIAPDQSILGTQQNTWEEAGNTESPGVSSIVEGIVGMQAGDKKDIEHTFASDHAVKGLKKKKAVYSVEVHEVREKVLPEVNEEFLKSVQAESEEALMERIKGGLENQKQQENYSQKRQKIGDTLRDAVDFEIPQSAYDKEKEAIMEDFARHYMSRGAEKEQMEAELTKSMDEIEKTARERVKLDLIVGKIAEVEKVKVTDEDISQIIYSQSMQFGIPIDQLVKDLKKDQERLNSLRQNALFSKTVKMLVDESKVAGEVEAPAAS